jgi:hypothetical protein
MATEDEMNNFGLTWPTIDLPPEKPEEEARAYEWHELTPEQQMAGRRVIQLVSGMLLAGDREQGSITESRRNPIASIFPVIRKNHWNNVILIDGGRGSGKTSLMASLLQYLRASLEQRRGNLWDGRVVPIAFLDLHPLPESAHILLHLVGRLESVVRVLEGSTSSWTNVDAPPWKNSDKSELSSRQRWRELFEAVVAWNSNLERRAGSLDFDFYAWELGREEARRRGISETFRNFVDALWRDASDSEDFAPWLDRGSETSGKGRPFFLIAIDDADLVPNRSVEILDLLRKLWHPNLVFLLTGDSDQFRALLRNYFLGVLLHPLAHINRSGEQQDIGRGDDERRASQLADADLGKLIPVFHRCKINALSYEEKLRRLKEPVDRIRLKSDLVLLAEAPKPKSLYYYFEHETYATDALPSQLRPFRSLKRDLERLADELGGGIEESATRGRVKRNNYEVHHRKIAEFIVQIWKGLLEIEAISDGDRETLGTVVGQDEHGMLVVDRLPVVCRYGVRLAQEVRLDERPGWRVAVGRDHRLIVSRPRSRFALPDSIKGLLKLATDLAADIQQYFFLQESPTPTGFDMAPVVIRWDDIEEFRPFRGFVWPLPDWHDFLSFTMFRKSWNAGPPDPLLLPESITKILGDLARSFLDITLNVAETRTARPSQSVIPLEDLSERVVRLAVTRETSKREQANAAWAYGRAGLLAAPEAGLPKEIANEWLTALREAFRSESAKDWERSKKELRFERRQHIRDRWGDGGEPDNSTIEEVLERIDRVSSEFLWTEEIEQRKRRTPTSPRRKSGSTSLKVRPPNVTSA